MKVRLYDLMIDTLLIIGVGIPLIFGGVLDTWRTILTISIIALTFIYILTHKIRENEKNYFLFFYIFCVLGITIYETISAAKNFSYSGYEQLYAMRQYIWILFAIPLYFTMIKKDINGYLIKIVKIVLVSLVLRTITWFCKNYIGITIFRNLLYEYGVVWERNGRQRLDATALIGVLVPVLFYIYKINGKKKYLIILGSVLLYLVFVSQSRTLIIGSMASVIAMIFFEKRTSTKKLFIQLSLLIAFIIALNTGFIDLILRKMNITVSDGSIGYRQYEYAYYSSLLIDGKWKTGLGILTSINAVGNKLIQGNIGTPMHLDDLGIFECFLQFGLWTILLYGTLFFYIIYVIVKCNQLKEYTYAMYLIGQLFYLGIVSVSLNLFGIQRSFSVPVILTIVCGIHNYIIHKKDTV